MAVAFTAVDAGRCAAICASACIAAFTAGRAGGCTAGRAGRTTASTSARILRHPVASAIELNRRLLDLRAEIRIEYIQIAAIPGDRVIIDGTAVVLVFLDTGLYRSEIALGDRLIVAAYISRFRAIVIYVLRKSKFRRLLLIPVVIRLFALHIVSTLRILISVTDLCGMEQRLDQSADVEELEQLAVLGPAQHEMSIHLRELRHRLSLIIAADPDRIVIPGIRHVAESEVQLPITGREVRILIERVRRHEVIGTLDPDALGLVIRHERIDLLAVPNHYIFVLHLDRVNAYIQRRTYSRGIPLFEIRHILQRRHILNIPCDIGAIHLTACGTERRGLKIELIKIRSRNLEFLAQTATLRIIYPAADSECVKLLSVRIHRLRIIRALDRLRRIHPGDDDLVSHDGQRRHGVIASILVQGHRCAPVACLITDSVVETGAIAVIRSGDEDCKRTSIRKLDHFRTRPFRRMFQE